jgi:hypothetical protein
MRRDGAPRLRTRAPMRRHRRPDGTEACGRLRAWRGL